jgi:hypothetical protein
MKGVALHDSSRRRGPKKSKTDPLSQCLSGEFQRLFRCFQGWRCRVVASDEVIDSFRRRGSANSN